MIIAIVAKFAIAVGSALVLLLASIPINPITEPVEAAVIQPEKYHWKYLTAPWKIPDANFSTAFRNDYQAPESEYGAGHRGIDFKSDIGVPVRSPVSGKVIEAQQVGYRNVITVSGNDGRLATMEPVCAVVKLNAIVYAGQVIAKTCAPQAAYVWHCQLCVHLSARQAGQYVSPMVLLGLFKPSVTKLSTD